MAFKPEIAPGLINHCGKQAGGLMQRGGGTGWRLGRGGAR